MGKPVVGGAGGAASYRTLRGGVGGGRRPEGRVLGAARPESAHRSSGDGVQRSCGRACSHVAVAGVSHDGASPAARLGLPARPPRRARAPAATPAGRAAAAAAHGRALDPDLLELLGLARLVQADGRPSPGELPGRDVVGPAVAASIVRPGESVRSVPSRLAWVRMTMRSTSISLDSCSVSSARSRPMSARSSASWPSSCRSEVSSATSSRSAATRATSSRSADRAARSPRSSATRATSSRSSASPAMSPRSASSSYRIESSASRRSSFSSSSSYSRRAATSRSSSCS